MKHALGCWLVLFVAVTAAEDVRQAIAVLSSEDGVVKGVIHFSQQGSGSPVLVTGNVTGLTGTDHGFHVHEKGDITNKCKGAGGHFNPEKKAHGAPNVTDRHVGDLGNILNEGGTAIVNINDSVISLYSSTHGIIGRAVVVHELQDDLGKGGKHDSNTTGAAGSRIACGVIGIQSPVTPWNNGASMPQSITAACLSLVVVHLLKNLVM